MKKRMLIIDDEKRMRRILQLLLEEQGYEVRTAENGNEGMAAWKTFAPHVVLTDIKMPQADGLEVLAFKNQNHLTAPLIILTAFGTIEKAVFAIKQGAFDYLTKPFKNNDVITIVKKALENHGQVSGSRTRPIIGSSKAVQAMFKDIDLVAKIKTSVLITGDSGTGKELVARAIHQAGNRSQKPLIKVNCSAIPSALLESELFGHVKGAFTGATSDRMGCFQKADQGVLFLDEIGDLPMELQPKLLHAVEDKTVTPVGSSKPRQVDVKIISASNIDFEKMMGSGRFRKDLFYRLNTFNIHLPRLKKRIEDIDELAHYFMGIFSQEFKKPILEISDQALRVLQQYDWPGNIRELRNLMERAVLTCRKKEIGLDDLPRQLLGSSHFDARTENSMDLEEKEKQLIIKALGNTGNNQVQAAKLLNISRNTLRYRIKKYNI